MAGDRPARERARDRVHRVLSGDIESLFPGRYAEAVDSSGATRAVSECEYAHIGRAVEEARSLGRVLDHLQSRRRRRGFERPAGLDRHLVGRREAAQELPELELVEDEPDLLVVVSSPARALELQLDGGVTNDGDHPFAE